MNTSHPSVTIQEARPLIEQAFGSERVPMLHGSPGMGKTSTLTQIANEMDLYLVVVSLKMYDPTTMAGVLRANDKTQRAELLPTTLFVFANDTLPINPRTKQPYQGVLLFFDEINTVSMTMQSAAYGIIEERRVGIHDLHPDTYIAAAGNHVGDNTGAFPMGPAMQTRLFHISLKSDFASFADGAIKRGIDPRIIDYLQQNPQQINNIEASAGQLTYPTERGWERMVSPMINALTVIDSSHYPLLAGAVGHSAAMDFIQFCQIYANLPKIQSIIANPIGVQLDQSQAAIMVATVSMCARHDELKDFPSIIQFIKTLPIEMQSWFTMQAIRYHQNNVRRVTAFNSLASDVGDIMY